MSTPLTVGVILGSVRVGRFNDKPAAWIADLAKKREGITVETIDLMDFQFPLTGCAMPPSMVKDSAYDTPNVVAFAKRIAACDAYIMVTPEYNHSTSAVLKNALDHVYAEWNNKAVGFVSYGSVGGARAVEHLRLIAIELQMAPVRAAVHIPAPWNMTTETGALKEGVLDPFAHSAEGMIEQVLWYGRALKVARSA